MKIQSPLLSKTSLSSVRSSGYTLVELMVAMALGLFLMMGVFQLNQANQKSSRLQDSLAQTQKNGRFAIDSISYAIKTAGYSGFYKDLSTGVDNALKNPTSSSWDVATPVEGFNNVSNGDNIAGITGFFPGTDVLLLKGMSQDNFRVIANASTSNMVVASPSAFATGEIVVVSDIDQASVFQISNATSDTVQTTLTLDTAGNTPGNAALLGSIYDPKAEIGKLKVQMLHIKNGQNGSPALFTTSLVNASGDIQLQEAELVSDVGDMQISYSVDSNNDSIVDTTQEAHNVTNWNQVIGINIAILATSNNDNVLPEKTSYSFDNNLVTFKRDAVATASADRRLKRSFTVYMPLRNRVL